MKKIPTVIFVLLLSVTSLAQTTQYVERLDSIVSDNGDIVKFTYGELFRTVMKNTFLGDKLVRKEVYEYAEDGTLSNYCAYEEKEGQFVLVHKKERVIKDDGRCVEFTDSVYVEDIKKMSSRTCETKTYDENNNLISRCTKAYDLQSDGASYKQHEIYYDAEGNKTNEAIIDSEYKYTKEYKDGKLYVMTKYVNKDAQWVIMESTVREYYEDGALKSEYTYDYSGIIFYMKNYVLYNENGEKVKSQEEQQVYSYKYIRDEEGRVKEIVKYFFDSEKIINREVFYYNQLPIDSAYYTLIYASDATEPYAKYYYIPNKIVDGKVEGDYSVYEKSDGSWVNLMANGNELSHSFDDKIISAHYEVNDETIIFTDYTIASFTDYGKMIRKQEKGILISEEEIYYDKSLSGSLIAGLEEDYKVSYVISRDADGKEVKNIYYYTSLEETTSVTGISSMRSHNPSVYNLHGQRLKCPQKGINIIEGRKMIFDR
ncbi:MAG: hypothetical protein II900_03340 [Prevotella sp.]|nr:hypothetical protein [Prevotella sp.]